MSRELLVVVPTYGAFPYAARAAATALECSAAATHVLVVDDASPDFYDPATGRPHPALAAVPAAAPALSFHRFGANGGLTRSWNLGLRRARDLGYEYCCVTNSDVVFSPGWDAPLRAALAHFAPVGPCTNAPGPARHQFVGLYLPEYRYDDSPGAVAATARALLALAPGPVPGPVNGFCLLARTETWWRGAFGGDCVFKPRNDHNSRGEPNPTPLMTLNEDELQGRWSRLGLTPACVPASFVFHYRSVSRGRRHVQGLWGRMSRPG